IKVCMETSTLASGIYYFEIGAMRFLPNNQHITLDRIKKSMNFEIIKTHETNLPIWNHNIYGSTHIPEMRILNDNEE
ncbi:MAG: hypothetical protein IKN56_01440, partial [Clostridia bacterium]|nr:hypothetical protein [Clostridia bacterium]